jgi:hypothetical protein
MFQKNIRLLANPGGSWSIELSDPKIDEICAKYDRFVNVRIDRPAELGTEEQNRAMHALLTAYYLTGLHSAPDGTTLDVFKIYMKMLYGPCYAMDFNNKRVIIPKSWADYSKHERSEFVDALISEINQSGAYAESPKIREIIDGFSSKEVQEIKNEK